MGRAAAEFRESDVGRSGVMDQYVFADYLVVRVVYHHLYFGGYTGNGVELGGGHFYDDIGR